jgi:exopolysaccharide production protein ExoQ
MLKAPAHPFKFVSPSTSTFDTCAMIPVLACAYSAIIAPLISFYSPPDAGLQGVMESRPENRIFWPALAAISLVFAARNWPRSGRLAMPPNMICLLAYLALAGVSVSWAFKPELSFVRFAQQVMVITAVILPAMVAPRTADIIRGLFFCFAFAVLVNILLIPGGYMTLATQGSKVIELGYQGYFNQKNQLGELAAVALLLSLHELLYSGGRRALGILVGIAALSLLFSSHSKTALALALFAPCLAGVTLMIGRTFRISPAFILVSITIGYVGLSRLVGFTADHLSYYLTGDPTFTGRAGIWSFAETEIARSPLLGWGYQSFWLVGPDGPSVVDAYGWIKSMPNAHNGYYDTMLELGYVGLACLLVFIVATLHVIGRLADRDRARAWLLLSVVLFIVIYNFLESLWMRAFDLLWVVFVIAAVEASRHWQSAALKIPSYRSRRARPLSPNRLRGEGRPRLRTRLGARQQ